MENKFKTSFIPKSFNESGSIKNKTPHNLLSIASTLLIFIVIAASAGVFIYGKIIEKQVAVAKEAAIVKEASFNYAAVDKIIVVDKQLKVANALLKNHTTLAGLFDMLEAHTLKSLRFTSFEFKYLSPTQVTLIMKGKAQSFGGVSKQADLLTSSDAAKKYFKSPFFSDLNLDSEGEVSFSFLTTIDPQVLIYNPQ